MLQNMYVTVPHSYKKYCKIVRFSNVNAMMHGLDGLLISLMHNNFLITCLLLFFYKLQNMYVTVLYSYKSTVGLYDLAM